MYTCSFIGYGYIEQLLGVCWRTLMAKKFGSRWLEIIKLTPDWRRIWVHSAQTRLFDVTKKITLTAIRQGYDSY